MEDNGVPTRSADLRLPRDDRAEAVFGKRLVRFSKVHAIHRGTLAWLGHMLTVAFQGAKHRSKSIIDMGFDGPFAIL